MNNDKYVDATFYTQVDPVWNGQRVTGAKATRLTRNKPDRPLGGTVTVKLTVRLPKAAFLPLRPEAVVVVPEDWIEANPVQVTAEPSVAGEQP